jgi:pyrimidine-nucleoside phosphorylase
MWRLVKEAIGLRAYDILYKKRMGQELSTEEINFLVKGFTAGTVPDYQMAAFAMAVCIQGMSDRETADLTMAMAHSGDVVDLSPIPGIKVDKHSTGGVGDKTSLVLVPMVAACGAPVAKMSGRGLGHTGGTLDKLESIPGFAVEQSREAFLAQVRSIGCAIVGQSGNLVPADKKLYALRDVTATVDNVPLIAASIMSKKIAGGADAIVLDVKTGSGAFMHTVEDSFALAEAMVRIGRHVGRRTVAVVTGMDQPLGLAVGNALEVKEAIDTLRGFGPEDLEALCLALGEQMLVLAGVAKDAAEARAKLTYALRSGAALAKLKEMVTAQGGDASYINQPIKLPRAERFAPFVSTAAGYVQRIDALALGRAAGFLGAGRETKESPIDLAVGVVLKKKVGDAVEAGEPLAELHLGPLSREAEARELLQAAFVIGPEPPKAEPLLYGMVTESGVTRFGA